MVEDMNYNEDNIFAKILRGEIPCKKIYENEFALAFYDAFPKKKIHALVIPKGQYLNLSDFLSKASEADIAGYFKAIQDTVSQLNLKEGYRVVSNCGDHGRQEVMHLHFHILGGEDVGRMVD